MAKKIATKHTSVKLPAGARVSYDTMDLNPEFQNFKDTPNINFWLTGEHTVYTTAQWDAMTEAQQRKISLDLGRSSFDDDFAKSVDEYWNLNKDNKFWSGHRKTRNYLIAGLIFDYTVHESVRKWCQKIDLDLASIRDIRSTTDFYVSNILPAACKTYCRLNSKPGIRPEAEYEVLRFVKGLMGAISLAEQY